MNEKTSFCHFVQCIFTSTASFHIIKHDLSCHYQLSGCVSIGRESSPHHWGQKTRTDKKHIKEISLRKVTCLNEVVKLIKDQYSRYHISVNKILPVSNRSYAGRMNLQALSIYIALIVWKYSTYVLVKEQLYVHIWWNM